jgi:hypothetical protein
VDGGQSETLAASGVADNRQESLAVLCEKYVGCLYVFPLSKLPADYLDRLGYLDHLGLGAISKCPLDRP